MMRIKEAIQRRRLIHEMNEDYKDLERELEISNIKNYGGPCDISSINRQTSSENGKENGSFKSIKSASSTKSGKSSLRRNYQNISGLSPESQKSGCPFSGTRKYSILASHQNPLQQFVEYLSSKLTDVQILNMLCEREPSINSIFYKSAFLSCLEDRRCGRIGKNSIATIRDHAHILVEFVDSILQVMFEGDTPATRKLNFDPAIIGQCHAKLIPLGFDRKIWLVFGECFAEVMFNQECIRAYPHAPGAWSLISVAMSDQMYTASKPINQNISPTHATSYIDVEDSRTPSRSLSVKREERKFKTKSCSAIDMPSNNRHNSERFKARKESHPFVTNYCAANGMNGYPMKLSTNSLPCERSLRRQSTVLPVYLFYGPIACRATQFELAFADDDEEEELPKQLPKKRIIRNDSNVINNSSAISAQSKFSRSKSEVRVRTKDLERFRNLY